MYMYILHAIYQCIFTLRISIVVPAQAERRRSLKRVPRSYLDQLILRALLST